MKTSQHFSFKTITVAGLVAGTLDILAAILVYSVIQQATTPTLILQFIASGIFGKAAFAGGWTMAFYGLIFHFFIALSFATAYFLAFPYFSFFKTRKMLAGLVYGLFVWMIMNMTVLPLVFQRMPAFQWEGAITGIVILMLCVGLPVSFITHKYYQNTQT